MKKRSRSQDPGHATNGNADDDTAARKRQKPDEPDLPPPRQAAPAQVQHLGPWHSPAALTFAPTEDEATGQAPNPQCTHLCIRHTGVLLRLKAMLEAMFHLCRLTLMRTSVQRRCR